jgi:NTE family protein
MLSLDPGTATPEPARVAMIRDGRLASPGRRRWLQAAAASSGTVLVGGCDFAAGSPRAEPRAPVAAPLDLPGTAAGAERVAWVFSSGGPRGFLHVGVLKGLAALGLAPDLVVGSSAGALAGTLWASGLDAGQVEKIALTVQPWHLLRWNPRGPEWLNANGLAALVNEAVGGRALQDLPVAAACVAVRLEDEEVVAFTRGDAGLAVQASAAIVGRLAPVRIGGARYADADLHRPLPVRLARRLGATRVLAVDASAHEAMAPPEAQAYREADLRKRALTEPDASVADVLLHPDTGYWTGWSRSYRERLIAAGEAAVHAQAAHLRALHGVQRRLG